MRMPEPRITPGSRREIGAVNALIVRLLGAATGGHPPHLFTTLARHRGLFRRWLRFAGALMPGGALPRRDSELVILRVAHNCGCEYEWRHHERLGALAGLSVEEVEGVRSGPDAAGWSARQVLLLRAADELHTDRTLSDSLWAQLRPLMSDTDLIELCLLVGHYEMLAMTLNALSVEPDPLPAGPSPRAMRALQAIVERRRNAHGA
jgi:AhpD family alkylhydroperoxidase